MTGKRLLNFARLIYSDGLFSVLFHEMETRQPARAGALLSLLLKSAHTAPAVIIGRALGLAAK